MAATTPRVAFDHRSSRVMLTCIIVFGVLLIAEPPLQVLGYFKLSHRIEVKAARAAKAIQASTARSSQDTCEKVNQVLKVVREAGHVNGNATIVLVDRGLIERLQVAYKANPPTTESAKRAMNASLLFLSGLSQDVHANVHASNAKIDTASKPLNC